MLLLLLLYAYYYYHYYYDYYYHCYYHYQFNQVSTRRRKDPLILTASKKIGALIRSVMKFLSPEQSGKTLT